MSHLLPIALYGLEVPPGGIPIPAMQEDSFPDAAVSPFYFICCLLRNSSKFLTAGACSPLLLRLVVCPLVLRHATDKNAQYRITMAALDPTEAPEADEDGNIPAIPRATLKLVRHKYPDLDDEDEYLQQLMANGGEDDDEEDSDIDSDDEPNGGPSDPSKSKKAKAEAALKKLIEAAQDEEDSDEDMADDADGKTNGVSKAAKKGKEPATSSDDDDESIDTEELDMEEFVVCTLDTERVSDRD